jgi:argininosuccinate lyase
MKLWEKGILTDKLIEQFTVGKDRELDLLLARYDVLGSIAHVIMLGSVGLVTKAEQDALHNELLEIYDIIGNGGFVIGEDVEDVHSQVELMLTQKLGDTGKRIHTARSRNDQVLLDIKLFIREELHQVVTLAGKFFDLLISQGERFKHILMPGYTHLQVAMPSSFGLWFGAYAESLTDDMQMMLAAYRVANQNPLGSAAGYGSSFPVNREQTTNLLGFDSMHYNVVNAQMSRGKTERCVAFALSSLAGTISKMAFDVCLFASQNFGFVVLPDEITTGSSIMPHKKNPDVFELLRARCNRIQALPAEIGNVIMNLPSGYFRDMQIIKESFLPVFGDVKDCIAMATFAMEKIKPVDNLLDDERYRYIFSVDEVNRLVMNGIPFREAYATIAGQIREGKYNPGQGLQHTHEGSIGNLSNDKIVLKMKEILGQFNFQKKDEAYRHLLMK